jgi:hypothetical protein
MKEYDKIIKITKYLRKVKLNGKYSLINKSGKEICECKYELIYRFVNGFAVVELNEKSGFIDEYGNLICECKYDHASNFGIGYAIIYKDCMYNMIDINGNEVVEWCSELSDAILMLDKYKLNLIRIKKLNTII